MRSFIRYCSPVGMLTAVAENDALKAVVLDGERGEKKLLSGGMSETETDVLRAARSWLDAYFSGDGPSPCSLPLAPEGTPFQKKVWKAVSSIPYGKTSTYGEIAAAVGSSPRAVGGAVGANPLLIVVPCHRVVGRNGAITGFSAGTEVKRRLLQLESMK